MRAMGALTSLPVLLSPALASAQTWTSSRTTPLLGEIVALDATGEANWPYGAEDLAGDGLGEFRQQEQSVDLRSVYAATDDTRFWIRLYVSDPNSAGGNVVAYVFIDADHTAATGGSAEAVEIDAKLVTDPTDGGYDYVVGVAGNGTIVDIWQWQEPQ